MKLMMNTRAQISKRSFASDFMVLMDIIRYWHNRKQVLPTVAEAVASLFGMGCLVFLYGPVGENDGKIDVARCVSKDSMSFVSLKELIAASRVVIYRSRLLLVPRVLLPDCTPTWIQKPMVIFMNA